MIPKNIRLEILQRLRATENTSNVRIVLAVESGSRAWGFASPDSDYDVRFIYAHPKEWYVAVDLEEKRDVIEYAITDEIDLNGWDLRKALRLYWKSNPAFVEWIQSPIVYQSIGCFAERVRALLPTVYSCERGIYHYRSMAKTNYRSYLRGESVKTKKYFYVLRPLLAARWIERHGTAAPIEFDRLLTQIDEKNEVLDAIATLMDQKRQCSEMTQAPPVAALNSFIEAELNRMETSEPPPKTCVAATIKDLNDVFHDVLAERDDNSPALATNGISSKSL